MSEAIRPKVIRADDRCAYCREEFGEGQTVVMVNCRRLHPECVHFYQDRVERMAEHDRVRGRVVLPCDEDEDEQREHERGGSDQEQEEWIG